MWLDELSVDKLSTPRREMHKTKHGKRKVRVRRRRLRLQFDGLAVVSESPQGGARNAGPKSKDGGRKHRKKLLGQISRYGFQWRDIANRSKCLDNP